MLGMVNVNTVCVCVCVLTSALLRQINSLSETEGREGGREAEVGGRRGKGVESEYTCVCLCV